jgi:hypothetical protein
MGTFRNTVGFVMSCSLAAAVSPLACGNNSANGPLPDMMDGGAPAPMLRLIAGAIGGSGNTDGTGAAARFTAPAGVATDGAGNIYVTDTNSQTMSPRTLCFSSQRTLDCSERSSARRAGRAGEMVEDRGSDGRRRDSGIGQRGR